MANIMVELLLQDARDDVGGAQDTGMLGILVRTGKSKFLINLLWTNIKFYSG